MITENEKAILKDVYNEYEGTRELIVSDIATGNTSSPSIKNYQTRSIDYNLKMNDIKFPIWVSLPGPLSGTYTLFTIDNEYRAPRDLVCTLILVGGGSAGGKGGTCYRGGGGSGYVTIERNYQLKYGNLYPIKIGCGGNYSDADGKLNDGNSTIFDNLTTEGGKFAVSLLKGGNGGTGGGAGQGSCREKGADGGSYDHPNGYDTSVDWIGGIGTGLSFDIKSLHSDFSYGLGGSGGISSPMGHACWRWRRWISY